MAGGAGNFAYGRERKCGSTWCERETERPPGFCDGQATNATALLLLGKMNPQSRIVRKYRNKPWCTALTTTTIRVAKTVP
eukprot:scaffold34630_cov185-Amphora_coffeaeformis.AAC.7